MAKKERTEQTVTIDAIGFEGISIARDELGVIFVKGGVPGDTLNVEVTHKRKKHREATIKEIITPSEYRITPRCTHFGLCGGCSWQQLEYSEQLRWKAQHVRDSFERLHKISVGQYDAAIGALQQYEYRNKMEFSFGASRWLSEEEIQNDGEIEQKNYALGLHIPGRFDKVLPIDQCHLQPNLGNRILKSIDEQCRLLVLTARNSRLGEGFLRNVIIRNSQTTEDMMIIVLTSAISSEKEQIFIDWLFSDFSEMYLNEHTTIAHAVNDTKSGVAIGEIVRQVGSGSLKEVMSGFTYEISPFSFFQNNPKQFERLLDVVYKYADFQQSDIAWDLYCGTGLITLPIARKVTSVIGIELSEESIEKATMNAQNHKIENASFFAMNLHSKEALALLQHQKKPNTIVIDPPRAGSHPDLIGYLNTSGIDKIVYVSCNPTTQARDCAMLDNYTVDAVTAVDLFPQTYHIESVALLTKRTNG